MLAVRMETESGKRQVSENQDKEPNIVYICNWRVKKGNGFRESEYRKGKIE